MNPDEALDLIARLSLVDVDKRGAVDIHILRYVLERVIRVLVKEGR